MAATPNWLKRGIDLATVTDPLSAASAIAAGLEQGLLVYARNGRCSGDDLGWWEEVVRVMGQLSRDGEDSVSGARNANIWTDVRYDAALAHTFRHSATAQPLHTDGAYDEEPSEMVLFLCEHQAVVGGETLFVSAASVDERALAYDPGLYHELWHKPVPYSKAGRVGRTVPVLSRSAAGEVLINWNYYRVAVEGNADIAAFRERVQRFLMDEVTSRLAVPLALAPGDAVVFKDRQLLHGRSAFIPSERCMWKCSFNMADGSGHRRPSGYWTGNHR